MTGNTYQVLSGNEYQVLAARTINKSLCLSSLENHALFGMVGEVGEIHSIFQKGYQGHSIGEDHLKKELGDLLWFIAEFCTVHNWNLEEIMMLNIEKLKARYPEGFREQDSLCRKAGDV